MTEDSKPVAALDVGSNSVKLLVAKTAGNNRLEILHENVVITRLSEGLSASGKLSDPAVDRTLGVLGAMVSKARELGVSRFVSGGTEALRKASNREDFINRIQQELGVKIQVLSGTKEAELSSLGVRAGLSVQDQQVIVDVGGGSTEIQVYADGKFAWRESFPIGAVALKERFLVADPVAIPEWQALEAMIGRTLDNDREWPRTPSIIGVGGTAATTVAVWKQIEIRNQGEIHGATIPLNILIRQLEQYLTLPLEQRYTLKGLERGRADVIHAGVAILLFVMARCQADSMQVSTWGLRHGLLLQELGDRD